MCFGGALECAVARVDPEVKLSPPHPPPEVVGPLVGIRQRFDLIEEPVAVYLLGVLVVDWGLPLVFFLVEAGLVGGGASSTCSPIPLLR